MIILKQIQKKEDFMEKEIKRVIDLYKENNIQTGKDIIYKIIDMSKKIKSNINAKFCVDDEGIRRVKVDIGDLKLKIFTCLADILIKNINCEYFSFNIIKDKEKIKIFAFFDKCDNRNKHLSKLVKKEIKPSDMLRGITEDDSVLSDFRKYVANILKFDVLDNVNFLELLNQNCVYEVSLITHNPLSLVAGDSPFFDSCHSVSGSYHVGNIQNMLSENVLMACILNSKHEIISRAWIYTSRDIDVLYIGRLYNGTAMPGICVVRAIEKALNKNFLIKRSEPEAMGLQLYCYFGYFDSSREFIRLRESKDTKPSLCIFYPKKIICVACGVSFEFYDIDNDKNKNYLCDNCSGVNALRCDCCDCIIDEGTQTYIENYVYCQACVVREFWWCDYCQNYHHIDKESFTAKKDNTRYEVCNRAFENGDVFECDDCGEYFYRKHFNNVNKRNVCDDCFNKYYMKCKLCNKYFDIEDANCDIDNEICRNCLEVVNCKCGE